MVAVAVVVVFPFTKGLLLFMLERVNVTVSLLTGLPEPSVTVAEYAVLPRCGEVGFAVKAIWYSPEVTPVFGVTINDISFGLVRYAASMVIRILVVVVFAPAVANHF
ncbi:MAG: hypothetical protein MZV70_52395 [Desulfobacterales bacterium]|nr:hypothetical protein [Desulfobacterales bacterium]